MNCEKCGKYSGKYSLCKECYYAQSDLDPDVSDFAEKNAAEDELVCPICGEPTSVYMGNARKDKLCRNHAKMLKSGEIYIDSHDRYREKATGNIISSTKNTKKESKTEEENENISISAQNNVIIINENNKSKCITCGRKTNGLLFCADCYRKYYKKELLFKITECSSVELLDEDYEGRYTCKDGHIVKSKSEREIDNFLFANDIPHAYEKTLPYGKSDKEVLHPDFYLPNYLGKGKHVWLEHWGYNENNLQYTKTKKFKMPIYEKLGITLICTYEKTDAGDIDSALERKLNKENISEGEINYKN